MSKSEETVDEVYSTHIKQVNILRAYYAHGYGRTTLTATGVLHLQLQAYNAYGYGHATLTATGVLHLWLRVYRGYNYGRATGVLWACGRV